MTLLRILSCVSASIIFIVACDEPKPTETGTDPIQEETCDDQRSAFYDALGAKKEELDARACTTNEECGYVSLKQTCGSSCGETIVNYDLFGSILNDWVDEYAEENCQACADYMYEGCLEPVSEPPSCIQGQCGL